MIVNEALLDDTNLTSSRGKSLRHYMLHLRLRVYVFLGDDGGWSRVVTRRVKSKVLRRRPYAECQFEWQVRVHDVSKGGVTCNVTFSTTRSAKLPAYRNCTRCFLLVYPLSWRTIWRLYPVCRGVRTHGLNTCPSTPSGTFLHFTKGGYSAVVLLPSTSTASIILHAPGVHNNINPVTLPPHMIIFPRGDT